MALNDTVTLITGGAGALAGPVASAFHRAGSRVVLVDLKAPTERAEALGGTALAGDLLDAPRVPDLLERALKVHGRLDHVVHTVGGFVWGPAWQATDADYDRMLDLNLRSLFHLGRAVLPVLRDQGHGMLAAVSAGQAYRGGAADVALYAAAKAGVAAWMRSVDAELAGTDVKATVLFPMGVIDTPANRAAMADANPDGWIDPDDLGEALVLAASTSRRGRLVDLPVFPGRAR